MKTRKFLLIPIFVIIGLVIIIFGSIFMPDLEESVKGDKAVRISGGKLFATGTNVPVKGSQLVISPDYNIFKIAQTGTIEVTKPSNEVIGSANIIHGLAEVPFVVAYVELSPFVSAPVPYTTFSLIGAREGLINVYYEMQVTATTVGFNILVPEGSSQFGIGITRTFRYYILVETAETP